MSSWLYRSRSASPDTDDGSRSRGQAIADDERSTLAPRTSIHEFQTVPFENLWREPDNTTPEFGVPGFIRGDKGSLRFIDTVLIRRQKGVLKSLIQQMGRNLLEGRSLINISLPVEIFEARSFLQRMTDVWGLAPLFLTRAARSDDPLERLKCVVCFLLGGLHRGIQQLKPFNPILGETYQAFYEDGSRLFSEQVSHHPPISAFQLFGPDNAWVYYGSHEYEASLRPNGMRAGQNGLNSVVFASDDSVITFQMPHVRLSGSLIGHRIFSYTDTLVFDYPAHNLRAEVTLNPDELGTVKSFFFSQSSPSDTVRGTIFDSRDDSEICSISGSWLDDIRFDGDVFWAREHVAPLQILEPLDDQVLPSDCRFRADLIALANGDLELAQHEKRHLEERQRFDRKLRAGKATPNTFTFPPFKRGASVSPPPPTDDDDNADDSDPISYS